MQTREDAGTRESEGVGSKGGPAGTRGSPAPLLRRPLRWPGLMLRPWAGRGRAFTLIEIMLVVVILGTLAAMMVPRFAGKQTKALVNTTRAEIANLSMLVDSFRLDAGRYPTTEEGLGALMERPVGVEEDRWDGPYLRELKADAWGNDYQYRHPGEFSVDFDLWSLGPDGRDGTEDDIRNVEGEK